MPNGRAGRPRWRPGRPAELGLSRQPLVEQPVHGGLGLVHAAGVLSRGAALPETAGAPEGDVGNRDLEVDLVERGDAGAHGDLLAIPSTSRTLDTWYDETDTAKSAIGIDSSHALRRRIVRHRPDHLLQGG